MIKITIPHNFIPERTYIIKVIFNYFLGIETEYIFSADNSKYIIHIGNSSLIIEDHFFSNYLMNNNYLDIKNIPADIKYLTYKSLDQPIPIIYGNTSVIENENNIIVTADLFATCFFMLTRWEEYVVKKHDIHSRFVAEEALAVKHRFVHRPIVQEIVMLILELCRKLGFSDVVKEYKFNFLPTHDIDFPRKWYNTSDFLKTILGDIVKRKSVMSLINNFSHFIQSSDPYNKIPYFIETSNKYGFKSRFYFLFNDQNITNFVLKFIKADCKIVLDANHEIGIHPNIGTFDNSQKLSQELSFANSVLKSKIKHSRQHFLQLQMPKTMQNLDGYNLKTDSSLYFNNYPGFRTGSCWDFPLFDFIERKALSLIEQTLCYMDVSVHRHKTKAEAQYEIFSLIDNVKKYNGNFVFLWHNSSFDYSQWEQFDGLYENTLKYASSLTD